MRAALSFACAAAVLGACAGVPRPVYPQPDARSALSRLQAATQVVQAIRAEARVDQRAEQGRIRGTVLMFVERGSRVRFDVMTQFGPIAILTSDREKFAYADLRERRYLTGATCPKNIARLLGVPLSVDETSRFLLGATPVLAAATQSIAWDDDGFYRIALADPHGARQEIDVAVFEADRALPAARQRLVLLRSELWSRQGVRVWCVRYEAHELRAVGAASVLLPMRVRVEQARAGADTLIRFKEIAVNPEIPAEAFVQSPRPGMAQEVASCD